MHRFLALALSALLATGCGFSHINKDQLTRPERSIGTGARILMPGESRPPDERPEDDSQITEIGGSSGSTDGSERTRDTPLGPLAVLFGYPFWIF